MHVTLIIPARFASTRFPGKPLKQLRGASGKSAPLIERTWRAGSAVESANEVLVATDDAGIAQTVRGFGGRSIMTPVTARNGTERCEAAIGLLDKQPDVVVNLQGDALLTPPAALDSLVAVMRERPDVQVATPIVRCDARLLDRLRTDIEAGRVGGTMVTIRRDGSALYFSKSVIPYVDLGTIDPKATPLYFHIGVYAYRPEALRAYSSSEPGSLELTEGLEQLRFLENGMPIQTVEVDVGDADLWELNNPQDVAPIEQALAARGLE